MNGTITTDAMSNVQPRAGNWATTQCHGEESDQ
jgi:hypothetical protein